MRKLIYSINVTLDGCCDHRQVGPPDDKVFQSYIDLLGKADTFVYGRKTYQLMVPYWPDVLKDPSASPLEVEYAKAFISEKMVVVSRSLDKAEGNGARIIREHLRDEILKLKQENGKDILTGGVDIPLQLLKLGLVDEIRFIVMPIIAGKGRQLWEGFELTENLRFKMVESKTFDSGSVLLRYAKQ